MGTQTWVAITIIVTECLIVFKFDWEVVTKPFPMHIALCWSIGIIIFILWIIWQFYLKPHLNKQENKKNSGLKEFKLIKTADNDSKKNKIN
jgi:hypothetical protein